VEPDELARWVLDSWEVLLLGSCRGGPSPLPPR
jgi:hypothetical protein